MISVQFLYFDVDSDSVSGFWNESTLKNCILLVETSKLIIEIAFQLVAGAYDFV